MRMFDDGYSSVVPLHDRQIIEDSSSMIPWSNASFFLRLHYRTRSLLSSIHAQSLSEVKSFLTNVNNGGRFLTLLKFHRMISAIILQRNKYRVSTLNFASLEDFIQADRFTLGRR
jgi:hypothetical protein